MSFIMRILHLSISISDAVTSFLPHRMAVVRTFCLAGPPPSSEAPFLISRFTNSTEPDMAARQSGLW